MRKEAAVDSRRRLKGAPGERKRRAQRCTSRAWGVNRGGARSTPKATRQIVARRRDGARGSRRPWCATQSGDRQPPMRRSPGGSRVIRPLSGDPEVARPPHREGGAPATICGKPLGLAVSHSSSLIGLDAHPIRVEVSCTRGPSFFQLVGLAEAAVREARVRVASALAKLGILLDEYALTVSLAPADLRKSGAALDVPLAAAILAAIDKLDPRSLGDRKSTRLNSSHVKSSYA